MSMHLTRWFYFIFFPCVCADGRYQPDSNNRNLVTRVQELTSAKEVWFRAAVIAVPIAGGLILVLLIMLALRMLRSENKRLQDQRQQMLSRLHYSFHGHHTKKGHVAKLDLECMVPVTGHENCCLTCDKMRQADLGNDKILSLVHWGMYSGHGKLEFVWPVPAGNWMTDTSKKQPGLPLNCWLWLFCTLKRHSHIFCPLGCFSICFFFLNISEKIRDWSHALWFLLEEHFTWKWKAKQQGAVFKLERAGLR